MEIVWTDTALADVETIHAYVQQHHPPAATKLLAALLAAGDRLSAFPERGRADGLGGREYVLVHPYVIKYRVEPRRVVILRVRHGRRRPDA